jgi:hypothetical protein
VSQAVYFKEIDPITNPPDHVSRSRGVVLGDPSKDAVQIIFRGLADDDLHIP